MSTQRKSKWTKVGAVLKGNKGPFAVLGNSKASNAAYNYDVKIQVKNGNGDTVMVKNPLLTFIDPRKSKNKDGQERNIPEKLLQEIFIVEDISDDSDDNLS